MLLLHAAACEGGVSAACMPHAAPLQFPAAFPCKQLHAAAHLGAFVNVRCIKHVLEVLHRHVEAHARRLGWGRGGGAEAAACCGSRSLRKQRPAQHRSAALRARGRRRTIVVNSCRSMSLSPLRSMASKYLRASLKPLAMLENLSSSSLKVKSFLPRRFFAACSACISAASIGLTCREGAQPMVAGARGPRGSKGWRGSTRARVGF